MGAQPTDEPAPDACERPTDCSVVWTVDDVCGCCGEPRRPNVEALSGRAAAERLGVGCPACECAGDPTMVATCGAADRCVIVDLLASDVTRCTTTDDCVIVGGRCGIPSEPVAVRRGEEPAHAALLGCTPRPPDYLEGMPPPTLACVAAHCLAGNDPRDRPR